MKLNTLFDDAESHGLEIDQTIKNETFIWAVANFYPHFTYYTNKELTALGRERKPLPDVDEVHDDLQAYLIAECNRCANTDVYIGINASCPTRKALIVGTEKLYKRAFERRAVEREKKEHPFWDNDELIGMEKKRAAKKAKRTASKSTAAAPTAPQDSIDSSTSITTGIGHLAEPDSSTAAAAILSTEVVQDSISTPAPAEHDISIASATTSTLAAADEAYEAGRSILRQSRSPASTTSSTRELFRTPVPKITEEAFFGGELYDATFGA